MIRFAISLVIAMSAVTNALGNQNLSGNMVMNYVTLKANDNRLAITTMMPTNKFVEEEQSYTVRVPVNVEGRIEFRAEIRTRTIRKPKMERVVINLDEKAKFATADGKRLSYEEVIAKTQKAQRVILVDEGHELPAVTSELLRPDVIVVTTSAVDDEKKDRLKAPARRLPAEQLFVPIKPAVRAKPEVPVRPKPAER